MTDKSAAPDDKTASYKSSLALLWHVTQKGLQAGCVLTTAVAAPVLLYRGTSLSPALTNAALKGGAAGAVLTTGLGAYKIQQLDEAGISDRVQRLAVNKGQNRTDAFAAGGAGLGAAVALGLLAKGGGGGGGPAVAGGAPMAVGGAACVGVAAGVLAHVVTNMGGKTE